MPANSFPFFYLYILLIYPLLPFFYYVRAMTRDSSGVISLCDDEGAESIDLASGSIPGVHLLRFPRRFPLRSTFRGTARVEMPVALRSRHPFRG